jgi:predicted RecB family nuclease
MKITKEIFKSFLVCPYKVYLLLKGDSGNKSEYEVVLKEIKEKYCAEALKKLSVKHVSVERIRGANLKGRGGVVYQTSIGQHSVYSDFCIMERVRGASALGTFYYVPMIFTPKERLSKEDMIEAAYDGFVLGSLQSRRPEYAKVVHGDGFRTTRLRMGSQIEKVKNIIVKIKKLDLDNPPKMILNRHCQVCEFKEACLTKAIEKDDLSLLAGIGSKEIETQNKKGIFTVTQYSYTFRPGKRFKKSYPFNLKALALREKKTHVYGTPQLPKSSVQIYLDVEGDPERDFYYLIGIIIVQNGIEQKHTFWAEDHNQEEAIFLKFIDCIKDYPEFKLYCYGSYETKYLQKMRKGLDYEHGQIVDKIFENTVNVLSIIYSHVFFPTCSNSLKDIGTYLGFRWTSENASGIQSLAWRKKFEMVHEQTIKSKLIEYNLEDCLALKHTVEFINKIGLSLPDDANNNPDVVYTDNLKDESGYKWGKVDFVLEDLEHINNCAYFDYQREKIFIRTNKKLTKAKPKPRKKPKCFYSINKHINVKFRIKCQKCGKRMNRWIKSSKQVIDLKFTKTGAKRWVEFYHIYKRRCQRCNSSLTEKSLRDLPKYGHSLKSWVIYNNVINHQPFDKISDTLKDIFDLSISGPCLHYFKKYFSEYYHETYQNIIAKIIQGNIVHIDETKISIKGQTGYVWVCTNMEEVYFLYKPTREGQFLNDLLKGFNGVLISDFYSAYDSVECPQQKCLIHLIRDLNDDLLANPFNEEYKSVVSSFSGILRKIVDTIDKYGLKKRNLNKHKKTVNKMFDKMFCTNYETELAQKYQKRFKKNQDKLFTFLNYNGVPWNNNNAEHALKYFAAYRNRIDYQISETGLKNYLILLSIYQTCKYKGINFLKFLVSKEKDIERFSSGRTKTLTFSNVDLNTGCDERVNT